MLPLLVLLTPDVSFIIFFFNDTATTEIYTLSLHDALPIFAEPMLRAGSPETVAASNLSGCCAKIEEARKMINREIRTARVQRAEAVIYDPHWTVNLLMRDRLQAGRAPHAQFLAVSCFLGASFSEAGK